MYIAEFMADDTPRHIDDDPSDPVAVETDLEDLRKKTSLRFSRLMVPIVLGLGVVGYFLWKKFKR